MLDFLISVSFDIYLLIDRLTQLDLRYSDIKDEQVRYFESHCRNSEMVPQLRSKLELLSSGTLSHSVPALVDLFCLCLIEVKTPSSATIAPVAEHV